MGKTREIKGSQVEGWTELIWKARVDRFIYELVLPDKWLCYPSFWSLRESAYHLTLGNTPLMKITALWTRFHQMSFPKMKELEAKQLEKFNNWTAHGPSMHNRKTKEWFGFRGKTQQNCGCWENISREPSTEILSMRDQKSHPRWELTSSTAWGGKGKRMPSSHATNLCHHHRHLSWDSPASI